MENHTMLDILILIARPGAGKSEIIDYLKQTPMDQRADRFHVGKILEFDDFPVLWTWFEQDHLLSQMGKARLFSDNDGYFLHQYYWDLLIEFLCLQYAKALHKGEVEKGVTSLFEFARGVEHGGYQSAFSHLSEAVLTRASILYVNVSWEESLRKNRKRFNPDRPDSILEHSLPDEKLTRLYRDTDFFELAKEDPDYLSIKGIRVPYAVFENEDDVTAARGDLLGKRLEVCLSKLWLARASSD